MKANWNEEIFEGRNKAYGAYQLRKGYWFNLLIATGITLAFLLFIFAGWPRIESAALQETGFIGKTFGWMILPPEPKPPVREISCCWCMDIPDATSSFLEGEMFRWATSAEVRSIVGIPAGWDLAPLAPTPSEPSSPVFQSQEPLPSVPNGDSAEYGSEGQNQPQLQKDVPAMNEFVLLDKEPEVLNFEQIRSIIWKKAVSLHIEGKVLVRVKISPEGAYEKHVIIRSIHRQMVPTIDAVIPQLKFKPGELNQKPIASWITIPFNCLLSGYAA